MLLANVIFPAPVFVYVLGALVWPVSLVMMLTEAASLWLFMKRRASFWRVLAATFAANTLSTLLGIALMLIPGLPTGLGTEPGVDSAAYGEPTAQWIIIARYAVAVCFLLSVLSEGAFYKWSKMRGAPDRPWRASLLANSLSYAPIMTFALAC